jgi:hypothetical protein
MTGTNEEPLPTVQRAEREEQTVTESGDRSFDWVAALALISGVAVLIPSFVALAATLLAIAAALL